MARSLTVLLPVHNAESTLADMVGEILEVVSELTDRMELMIVDDGSDDMTSEIGIDLDRRYPQIHFCRHGQPVGRESAIQTGLQHSTGEIILLHDQVAGVGLDELPKLFRTSFIHSGGQEPSPAHLRSKTPPRRAGFRVIARKTIEAAHGPSQPARPNYLGAQPETAIHEQETP